MQIATSLIGAGTNLGHVLPLMINTFSDKIVSKIVEVPEKILLLAIAAPAAVLFVAVGCVEVVLEDIF